MAKLPVYNEPQTQVQGISGGMRQQTKSSQSEMLGLAGQAAQIGLQAKEQADTLRTEDAVNQLRAKQQEFTGWVRNIQGKNAFDPEKFGGEQGQSLEQVAAAWMDGAGQEIDKTLSNDNQKQMFQRAHARLKLEFNGHVNDHLNRQVQVVADDTFKSTVAAETQQMAIGSIRPDGRLDWDSIAQSLGRLRSASQVYANQAGLDAKNVETEVLSVGHAQVLDALLKRNNTQGAQVYFDTNKAQMSPKVVQVMEGRIQEHALANDVQVQAQALDASGLGLEERLAKVDMLSKGNPVLQHALRTEVVQRFGLQEKAIAKAQDETIGRLMDMRFPTMGTQPVSLSGIMRTKEWASITPQDRRKLLENWESEAKERAGKKVDDGTELARYGVYKDVMDRPVILRDMSDAQIIGRYGKLLGTDLTKKLLDQKRIIEKDGEPKIDPESFKDIAGGNGIPVNSTKDVDKKLVVKLRDRAEQAILEAERAQGGKPLKREEKAEIIKGLTRTVSLETYRSNWWNKTEEKRLFEIDNPAEVDAAMVADPKVFADLLGEFEKAGVVPTKERLRNAYLIKYSKGK